MNGSGQPLGLHRAQPRLLRRQLGLLQVASWGGSGEGSCVLAPQETSADGLAKQKRALDGQPGTGEIIWGAEEQIWV